MIKQTTLAVLGLAVSGLAVAGSMGPVCTPGNVTVPCVTQQWDIGVQALYLKSIYSGNRSFRASGLTPNTYNEVENDWDWGYRIEGSYHFNTGNDVTMTWVHYETDLNQGLFRNLTPSGVPNQFVASNYTLIGDTDFDQVNLVMGQFVDVSAAKKLRFYGGMQYVHLRDDSTNYYTTSSPLLAFVGITGLNQFSNTDYKGFGPTIGLDYAYKLTEAFSVTANSSGSILYGTRRLSAGFVGTPVNVVLAPRFVRNNAIVPSLEAKLGVNYAHNMAQGTLNLEAGYEAINYFDITQSLGSLGIAGGTVTSSNYGLYGPYFGLKYVGNA